MERSSRFGSIRSIAIAVAVGVGLGLPAVAQQEGARESGSIDEIIVTATKREQSLQEVPIAVSAFQGEDLETRGITELEDLQQISPSISVYGSNSTSNGGTLRIRGMGTTGNNPGLESAVGSFIDGVYRSRSGQAYGDFLDVERIEILRGPQGTLFGKNTSAGAVQIITKKPSFDWGGQITGSYGNYDHKKVTASVTGPLIADLLAFRIAGSWHERDGYYEDVNSNDAYNSRDRYSLRGQLLLTPTEDFEARLIVDYSDADEDCCPAAFQANGPSAALVQFLGGHVTGSIGTTAVRSGISNRVVPWDFNPAAPAGLPVQPSPTWDPTAIDFLANQVSKHQEGRREVGVNFEPVEDIEDRGVSLEMNFDWNEISFTSITAWRNFEVLRAQDIDFTSADILRPQDANDEFENLSQELRAVGTWGDLDWLVGVYLYSEDVETNEQIRFSADGGAFFSMAFGLPPTVLAPFFPDGIGYSAEWESETEGYAIFTQNTYHVNEALDITLGLRYSREEKEATGLMNGGAPGTVVNDPTPGLAVPGMGWCEGTTAANLTILRTVLASFCDNASWERKATERELTGTLSLSYAINEDLNTYVSYSRGYKAGGFNLDQESVDAVICNLDQGQFDGQFGVLAPSPTLGQVVPMTGTLVNGTPSECAGLAPGDIARIEDNARFDPEFANSYEIGLKGTFLDGALVVNSAVFFTKFEDFQLNTFNGFGFTISNVSQVESRGFEVESFWTVNENLFVTLGFTYADTRYGDNLNLSNPLDAPTGGNTNIATLVDGERLTHAPAWQGSASFVYEDTIPGTEWSGFFATNVAYRGPHNTGSNLHAIKRERANTLVNARLGARSPDGTWEIELWGNNITDEFVNTLVFDSVFQSGSFHTFFNPPRMYGITVKYNFGEGR